MTTTPIKHQAEVHFISTVLYAFMMAAFKVSSVVKLFQPRRNG